MVKLAIGSIGDSFSVGSIKSYLAEFIATLLFVFAGVGSAISYGMWVFLDKKFVLLSYNRTWKTHKVNQETRVKCKLVSMFLKINMRLAYLYPLKLY